jgi:hypothetical protein
VSTEIQKRLSSFTRKLLFVSLTYDVILSAGASMSDYWPASVGFLLGFAGGMLTAASLARAVREWQEYSAADEEANEEDYGGGAVERVADELVEMGIPRRKAQAVAKRVSRQDMSWDEVMMLAQDELRKRR